MRACLAALMLATLACTTPPTPAAPTPQAHPAAVATATRPCRAADLQATFAGVEQLGGGQARAMLLLQDVGARSCHLAGVPHVDLLSDQGATLHTDQGADCTPQEACALAVLLTPYAGGSTYDPGPGLAMVNLSFQLPAGPGTCSYLPHSGAVMLTLPAGGQVKVPDVRLAVCFGELKVSPFQAAVYPKDWNPPPTPQQVINIDGAALVARGTGWVHSYGRLLWTSDAGASWSALGLTMVPGQDAAVDFIDGSHGWVAELSAGNLRLGPASVFRTTDRGRTWRSASIDLSPNVPVANGYSGLQLFFLDELHGWLLVGHSTSTAWSVADLYSTGNGGETWTALGSTVDAPVVFTTPWVGFMAGGVVGRLYRTNDGGRSWQPQQLQTPDGAPNQYAGQLTLAPPRFFGPDEGVLPATYLTDSGSVVVFYVTHDGGRSWQMAPPWRNPDGDGYANLQAVGPNTWFMAGYHRVYETVDSGSHWVAARSGGYVGSGSVDFVDANFGWVVTSVPCAPQYDICRSLYQTTDGGQNFTPLFPGP